MLNGWVNYVIFVNLFIIMVSVYWVCEMLKIDWWVVDNAYVTFALVNMVLLEQRNTKLMIIDMFKHQELA